MHEVSLIRTILRALDETVPAERAGALHTVRLKVGMLSGVEPVLLEVAWGVVVQDSPWAHVAVAIDAVPVEVHCAPCDARFTPVHQRFACPTCGTPSRDVRAGQELLIHQLVYGVPVQARGSFDSAAVGRSAQDDDPAVVPSEGRRPAPVVLSEGRSPESKDRLARSVVPSEPRRGASRDPATGRSPVGVRSRASGPSMVRSGFVAKPVSDWATRTPPIPTR